MIDLQVLGRLELRAADGRVLHSVLAQPKRQALLVYLAVAVPRGYHRRDTLIGLLWPESDDEHARGSLSKAVSHLRQVLGNDAVVSRGHAELGLEWQLVWSDVVGFEEALDRGALAEAMALYRGELLPGFHVDEAPAFDQWLERERARLRGRAVQATRILSEREEAAGRLSSSIEWARRAASLEPFDESIVRRLMTVLDAASDRAGALRTYDEFAAMLRAELETEPTAETKRLMETIRNRTAGSASIPVSLAPTESLASPPQETAMVRPGRSRNASAIAAGFVGLLGVAVAGWALLGAKRVAVGSDAPTATVAVLPFLVEGTPAVSGLGEGMVSLLAERLNHDGPLRALDAKSVRRLARAVSPDPAGADTARVLLAALAPRFVLLGHVIANGDSLRIHAALFDSSGGQYASARAEVAGKADDIARLSEEVVAQIIAVQPMGIRVRHRPPVGELTPSLLALRAFLTGEQEMIAGRFTEAAKAYKAAVDADTSFALAYLNLSRAANWAGDEAMSGFARQRALLFIRRLSWLDQFRVRAWAAYHHGDPIEAERLTRLVLINDIGLSDAWYDLGELRFHWGPVLGWSIPEAREAYEQALAISSDAGTLLHLTRIAAAQHRVEAVDSLVGRALSTHVDEPQALELRALQAYALGNRAAAERVHSDIARLDGASALAVVTVAAVYGAEYPAARDAGLLLQSERRPSRIRMEGVILAAEVAAAHGRFRTATEALGPGSILAPARSVEYRAALAALPFRQTPAAGARSLRSELLGQRDEALIGPTAEHLAVNSIYPARRLYLLAMLSLKAADSVEANRYVMQLEQPVENTMDRAYQVRGATLVRAEMLRAQGKSREALTLLGKPEEPAGRVLPDILQYPAAHERYLRGQLAANLGQWSDALRWFGTFPDPGGYDLPYLAAVHTATGDVYSRMGKRDSAQASYRRAAALLADADAHTPPAR